MTNPFASVLPRIRSPIAHFAGARQTPGPGPRAMIDTQTAALLRLLGLTGFILSMCAWAIAERTEHRKTLISFCAGAALLSASLYLLGVVASAESGASRLLPRFP